MNKKMKKVLHSSEFYVVVLIVLFSLLVEVRSGQFFTGNNLVDLIRAFTVPAMFAVGELMVLISGVLTVHSRRLLHYQCSLYVNHLRRL